MPHSESALVLMAALLIAAGAFDARTRLIPNWISVALAVVAVFDRVFVADWATVVDGVAAAAIVFAAGAVAFHVGVLGGADVKLMTAVSLATGFTVLPMFVVLTALAGGVLALAYMAARAIRRSRGGAVAAHPDLPYAVPIAIGAALAFVARPSADTLGMALSCAPTICF